ncbi:MAG: hypothetical protein IPP97_01945 [Candidatus Obscuribacter sp.]|nr:hypothetical protein [Candidatus Obscuribacter sp.]MBP6350109.1 hypothetical protein [Candidatus Obscuribacter sp.]MBP6592779.1 hypothetical protein [Candidatus Obscuribacter sp.]
MRIPKSICLAILLVAIFDITLAFAASARTIDFRFPSDETYGQLYDDAYIDSGLSRIEVMRKRLGAAKGTYRVTLPDNHRVVFEPNHRLYINPAKLAQFGPNGIEIVRITFIPMEDKENDYALNLCKNMHYLKFVQELKFNGSEIGDREVAALGPFANLSSLALSRTNVSGSVSKALGRLTTLNNIEIGETFLHPIDFAPMAALKSLRLLQLSSSNVNSDDLKNIAMLKSLLELRIDGTNVDDRGIKYLEPLTNLRSLYLGNTKVTLKGLRVLKGRQLIRLNLPVHLDNKADRAILAQYFPGTSLVFEKKPKKKADSDINEMFRPLH